jgi:shikimate kinase
VTPIPFVVVCRFRAPLHCYANNHELLNGENKLSIYLRAPIDTLYNRLLLIKAKDPFSCQRKDAEMKEFIAVHLLKRSLLQSGVP